MKSALSNVVSLEVTSCKTEVHFPSSCPHLKHSRIVLLAPMSCVSGNSGRYLDQITFITNKRDIGPFGMEDPGPDSFNENRPNCTALFFFGRSGAWMDSLGLVYECPE